MCFYILLVDAQICCSFIKPLQNWACKPDQKLASDVPLLFLPLMKNLPFVGQPMKLIQERSLRIQAKNLKACSFKGPVKRRRKKEHRKVGVHTGSSCTFHLSPSSFYLQSTLFLTYSQEYTLHSSELFHLTWIQPFLP